MSKKNTAEPKHNASHNYLNTQKSNAHTKVNGNLVQLWFGSQPILPTLNVFDIDMNEGTKLKSLAKKGRYTGISKLALLGVLATASVGSTAYAAQQQINPTGGVAADGSDGIKVHVIDNGQLQIKYKGLTQVYAPGTTTESTSLYNGTYIAVGGNVSGSNNGGDNITVPLWGEASQTITGTGVSTDPYVVTTTLFTNNDGNGSYSPSTDTEVVIKTKYESPNGYFTQEVTVTPPASNTSAVKFYHAIDTYLSGGDNGPAFSLPQNLAATNDTVGNPSLVAVRKDPGGPNDSFEGFAEIDGDIEFSHWVSGKYNDVAIYGSIPAGGDMVNKWDTNPANDNGLGVQFDLGVINTPTTFSYNVAFSGEAKINLDPDNSSGAPVLGGYKSTFLLGGAANNILDTDAVVSNVVGDIDQVRVTHVTHLSGDTLTVDVASLPAGVTVLSQTATEIILTAPAGNPQTETTFNLALQTLGFTSTSTDTSDRSFEFRVTNELGEEGSASGGALVLAPFIQTDTPIEGDNIINGTESGDVTISGTTNDVAAGQIVTVTISDGINPDITTTATVGVDGSWTAVDVDVSTLSNGAITVNAQVTDLAGTSVTDSDAVTLAINNAPVGVADSATTNEDTAVNIGVVGNDSDTDGDALIPTNITAPTSGTAVLNADGVTIDYTPNANFNGVDTFTYTPNDGTTDGAPVTVTVTVDAINDAPVGVVDSATTNEDTVVNIGVVGNDSDIDGDALTPTNITLPTNGTAVLNADGVTIDYTPNADFNGTDTFTYTPNDGTADGAPITVTVNVAAVNDAPVGVADSASTNEDTAVNIAVVGNDTDTEGDTLTPTNISLPANGTAVLNADGVTIDYTPDADFNGTDTFTYIPNDGTTDGAPVTVTVTVDAVNDAPVGVADSATTNEDTAVNIAVVGNDTDTEGDTLTPTNLSAPVNGTAVLNADGVTIDYTPNADFNGSDTFTYTPNDGTTDGAPITVTVNVVAVNDAPVGVADSASTNEDTAVNIVVVGNDSDADGDALTPTNILLPANGTAVLNADGVTIDYTPNADFNGTDTFTYTPNDGTTDGTPITVTINVAAINDAPVGVADSATTNEDTAVNIAVVGNDTDTEGDTLTPTNISLPANGTAVLNADGVTIDYTPDADFNGTDTFTYTPNDGTADGTPITVTINVAAVNDAPVGVADSATTNEDTAVNITVVANDMDTESDTVTPTNISLPANGTAVLNGDGVTIDYTPNADFNGTDTFTYTPNDGTTDGAPITVTVNVAAVNDAPVGVADTASTNEDTAVNIAVVGNDTDTDGDTLTPTNITSPANGTAVLNADGVTIDYTPNADFNGSDTFTYTPNDGSTDGAPVTVTVTVDAINDAPVGVADVATTNEDTAVNIGVVGNDTDTDGDALTPTNLSTPANGTAVLNADGVTIDYTPNADFNGTDTFTYTPNDGSTDGAPVTVTVTVDAINDAPDGVADSVTTSEDTAVNIDVVDNDTDTDGDTLTPTNLSTPVNGIAVLNADGVTIDYTPNADFNGSDTFTYTPNDGTTDGAPVTVTITVASVNDAPVGVDDTASTNEDTVVNIDVVGNDTDTEGDALTATNLSTPSNGTVSVNADGSISYTPATNFSGLDTFTYTPNDGTEDGAPVTVTVTITADTDGDGIPDAVDLDDDNDGIPDLVEGTGDTDGDGIIDSLDLDSDNDGILDIIEAGGVDSDHNGVVDDATDTDQDGLADSVDANPEAVDTPTDAVEAALITTLPINDTDSDGTPDFQDVDSDNDGISDLVEGVTDPVLDTDGDGHIDISIDAPVNPDTGIATGLTPSEVPDTDVDGVPDYRDLDSDNDGLNDVIEAGGTDENEDGIIDTPNTLTPPASIPDADGNGISDPLEPNNPNLPAAVDPDGDGVIGENGTIPPDTDGDGIPDALDGGDGFNNNAPLTDTDGDGIPDVYDIDDDNDGIPDVVEGTGDTDNDGINDSLDLDSDNDGILDLIEAGGTDIDNDGVVDDATDTDNDGLADVVDADPEIADAPTDATTGAEITLLPVTDTDGDGTSDFQDVDSDNDGISDLVEGGTDPALDTDGDGDIDTPVDPNTGITTGHTPSEVPDTDGDGVPDYRDLDSDNDGLNDVEEAGGTDENEDGIIDTPNELIDGENLPDTDNDGIPDALEPSNPNLSPVVDTDGDGIIDDATDTDGDGIPDVTDRGDGFGDNGDTDNDGIPDLIDLDDDNDGIPDLVEGTGDTDGDGIIDSLDLDSDNDGILDIIEAGGIDSNNDGVVDDATDTDNDGLADVVDANPETADTPTDAGEAALITTLPIYDTDSDGTPDFQDVDSDNDGISDLVEGGTDPALDTDNDGDIDAPVNPDTGIAIGLTPSEAPNTDGDGVPDYRDLDSDNDGLNDVIEGGGSDENGDGQIDIPDTLVIPSELPDTDNDGLPDVYEPNNPNLPADLDADGDGVIDDATDTDGDGVPDVTDVTPTEFGVLLDTDRDGIPDTIDLDDDNDGIPDLVEQATAQNGGDTDGDGIPDELDMDSDGDGISDLHESGLTAIQIIDLDSNNDGIIDAPVGTNGLADAIETDDTQSAGQDFDTNGVMDTPADTDGDGRPDFQDLDSDNDGIHDLNEGGDFDAAVVDTNNDGVIDNLTQDADGDGIPDSIDSNDTLAGGISNSPRDTDHDGVPDYRELDSDGDGIFDLIEGDTVDVEVVDTNNDGMLDNANVDSDNDGIPDSGDSDVAGYGDTQETTPVDSDGDSIPDYNDLDSDNDSLSDVEEAGHQDLDGDGLFDTDGTRSGDIKDADGDGIPDFREVDSDDDGVFDIEGTAYSGLDANHDGRVDSVKDTDKDGVMDDVDSSPEEYGVRSSDDKLETAVSGFGGSTGPWGIFTMMMLLGFKRLRSTKLLQRFFPMLLIAMFIVPGLLTPTTAQAETKIYKTTETGLTKTSSSKCGTQTAFNACTYVAGSVVQSHVDPEGKAGGWSTSDDMSTGFSLIVGRHFKPHWFGELSYTDMGEAELSNSAASITGKESISYKVPSLHIGYLLRDPSKQFNLYAKGGISAIQNKASASRVPYEKQTSIQATFGLGGQWQAKKSGLFARLGADFYDRDAIAAGLTVGYKFGKTYKKVEHKKVVRRVVKQAPVVVVKKPILPIVKEKPVVIVKRAVKKPVVKKRVVRSVVKQACFTGVLKGVNFHTNSAVLTAKAEGVLKEVVKQLKCWDGKKVTLIGHTDSVGSNTKNLSLSKRRANSVKMFLIKQGVKAQQMVATGKGETQPRATNKTKAGRALNRRVELRTK